ncbi:hypothetical protein [Halocatena pleomorpha]|uniref:Uncharacterized protein n=1 Tax=Halocatena pleomorpha TaxID=1785090 RepID=A0A3P3RKP0_9EURY|nr:hypothetical protein [Halocatena pleomorpha]RRJ34091.1 hypothetical protein EIK79_00940 [Halocatena pleomorpha]
MVMFVPSTVRDESLSLDQRDGLRRWVRKHHTHESFQPPLLFALVVAGDKPATHITPRSWAFPDSQFETDDRFLAFVDRLDLEAHALRGGHGWYVAPTHARFDLLPSSVRAPITAAWHRRLGTVFGYPPTAIEHFIETDSRVDPRARVEHDGFAPEEIAYTKLVFYRHDDSIAGYERAIENGKTMRDRFAELAEHWEIPTLDQLAEEYYQLAVAVYSGDRDAFPGELTDFRMIARG